MTRLKGSNLHGNKNELMIVKALNNKKFKDLNLNMKNFIRYIAKNENIELDNEYIIKSIYEKNNKLKQDLYVVLENRTFGISVKMGKGNSTHQEKCEDFIDFILKHFNDVDQQLCDDIRFFAWCDGTLNGTGPVIMGYDENNKPRVISRLNKDEFINKYPMIVKRIQDFLIKHEEDLLKHYLLVGNHDSKVDYIYHGTIENGLWTSSDAVIDYQLKNSKVHDPHNTALLSIGRMNIQVWNRGLNGSSSSEKKRGQLQLKYSSMEKDFAKIMFKEVGNKGTFIGDMEEFDISKVMNQNKKHKNWKLLNIEDNSNIYVVKVDKKILSHLSNKKVFPKSDAYLIQADISKDFLLEREYLLKENYIQDLEYNIISNTGISVKQRNSKKFTYQKFTKNSFLKAFENFIDNPLFVFCGLLLYSNVKDMDKNEIIFSDLNIKKGDFIEYVNRLGLLNMSLKESKDIDLIRKIFQNNVKNIIESNHKLKESIFTGKYWFDEPYFINYILRDSILTEQIYSEYIITTGSGRSKRRYSIIIKPESL